MSTNYFIIRDDDTNHFTTPDDLERWYADLFKEGVPVSLAVIPRVKHESDVFTGADAGLRDGREYPIGENAKLVEYLKGNRCVEIMQHGYTHETVGGVFEYAASDGLMEKTLRGKEELERTFGVPVKVFVAPHDSLSNEAIRAVESARLDIVRSKGSRNVSFRPEALLNYCRMAMHRIAHPDRHAAPPYPQVLDYGKHKEAYSARLENGFAALDRWMAFAKRQGGHFVLVTHVHDGSEEKKKLLGLVVERARELGFSFEKASKMFE